MHIKQDIRARLFGVKVSVNKRNKKEEKLVEDIFKDLDGVMEALFDDILFKTFQLFKQTIH